MENTESFNSDMEKPAHGGPGATTGKSKSRGSNSAIGDREKGPGLIQKTKDFANRSAEFYDQTKKTISGTYNKTTKTLDKTYGGVLKYGRQNPGKLLLVGLGGGFVIGLLLANRSRVRQKGSEYAESAMNSVSQIASKFLRRGWLSP